MSPDETTSAEEKDRVTRRLDGHRSQDNGAHLSSPFQYFGLRAISSWRYAFQARSREVCSHARAQGQLGQLQGARCALRLTQLAWSSPDSGRTAYSSSVASLLEMFSSSSLKSLLPGPPPLPPPSSAESSSSSKTANSSAVRRRVSVSAVPTSRSSENRLTTRPVLLKLVL